MEKRVTFNTPGEAHELTFSTSGGVPLYETSEVRAVFLSVLDKARARFNFELWAYVVMPNHVHLLIFPRDRIYDIDKIRGFIKQHSAFQAIAWLREHRPEVVFRITFREESNMRTRFWQDGKGYDRNIVSRNAVRSSIEYIHNNPVRKSLCESPLDWPGSSVRQFETGEEGEISIDPCRL